MPSLDTFRSHGGIVQYEDFSTKQTCGQESRQPHCHSHGSVRTPFKHLSSCLKGCKVHVARQEATLIPAGCAWNATCSYSGTQAGKASARCTRTRRRLSNGLRSSTICTQGARSIRLKNADTFKAPLVLIIITRCSASLAIGTCPRMVPMRMRPYVAWQASEGKAPLVQASAIYVRAHMYLCINIYVYIYIYVILMFNVY